MDSSRAHHPYTNTGLAISLFSISVLENCGRGKKKAFRSWDTYSSYSLKAYAEASQVAGRKFAAGFRSAAGQTCMREPVDENDEQTRRGLLGIYLLSPRHAALEEKKNAVRLAFFFFGP